VLALSPDNTIIVVGGNFNRFLVLPIGVESNNQFKGISLQKLETLSNGSGGFNDSVFGLAFIPNSKEKILATSNSAGFIAIWNLSQCKPKGNSNQQINDLACTPIDSWQNESPNPIRTLAFNEDGSLLVSGGDDGRVVVWHLTSDYKLDKTKSPPGKGTQIFPDNIIQISKKINSVDLKNSQIVISGSEDSQVRLHHIK
jgi:WD40 repeat protein